MLFRSVRIVVISSDEPIITDAQSALDLLATANYDDDSNHGRDIFFVATEQGAIERCGSVGA